MPNQQPELEDSRAQSPASIRRRDFLRTAGGALAAAASSGTAMAAGSPQIAFNTADLVARVTNYRFELKNAGPIPLPRCFSTILWCESVWPFTGSSPPA